MKFLERALDHQNQWWKYFVMFLICLIIAQFIGILPLGILAIINGANPENLLDFDAMGIDKNLGLFLMMLPFVIGFFAFWLLIKLLHKRTIVETINGRLKIRWKRFFYGAFIWGGIFTFYSVIDYFLNSSNYSFQFNLSTFLPLLLISLIFIPLQTTLEELLFRGYFAQGLGAWTKSRWVALFIPSLIFGLMHVANPEVKEYGFWVTMPQYIGIGMVFGLISILDDGIELAMGGHAINNILLSIFLTSEASVLQTHAMFTQLEVNPLKETLLFFVFGTIFIAILAYTYKWKFSIMNEKLEYPEKMYEEELIV